MDSILDLALTIEYIDENWDILNRSISVSDYSSKAQMLSEIAEEVGCTTDDITVVGIDDHCPQDLILESGDIDPQLWDYLAEFERLGIDPKGEQMILAYMEANGFDVTYVQDAQDRYIGKFYTMRDYAQHYIEEHYPGLPYIITANLSYSEVAEDLEHSHTFSNGHVFLD